MLMSGTCARFMPNVGNQKRYSGYQSYLLIDLGPLWNPNISSQLGFVIRIILPAHCGRPGSQIGSCGRGVLQWWTFKTTLLWHMREAYGCARMYECVHVRVRVRMSRAASSLGFPPRHLVTCHLITWRLVLGRALCLRFLRGCVTLTENLLVLTLICDRYSYLRTTMLT